MKRQLGKEKNYRIFGQPKSAVDVAKEVFDHLRRHAKDQHNLQVQSATVTIPIYFDGRGRRELRDAADRAGVFIKTFVHEPFAALVGYCHGGDGNRLDHLEGRNILVFDWGGGTLDITVAAIRSGTLVQLSGGSLTDRAGDSFDHKLHQFTFSRFLDKEGLRPTDVRLGPTAKDRYLAECERAKIALSNADAEHVQVAQAIRSDHNLYDIDESIVRADFESLIQIDVKAAMREVDRAIDEARLTSREVDLVLLIGGSSLIPFVQSQMAERFGARIVPVSNADTIIAEGAALVDSLGMQPVLSRPFGVRLADGSFYEIFPAGTAAKPEVCQKTINFFCTDNRDGEAKIILVERMGQKEITKEQVLSVPVSPALPRKHADHERVVVGFSLDQDLILHVTAKGATQARGGTLAVHDLLFALSTREAFRR
jgi:molecular chaperone DnaK (HSP70)